MGSAEAWGVRTEEEKEYRLRTRTLSLSPGICNNGNLVETRENGGPTRTGQVTPVESSTAGNVEGAEDW